jgi:hypothetical protein
MHEALESLVDPVYTENPFQLFAQLGKNSTTTLSQLKTRHPDQIDH